MVWKTIPTISQSSISLLTEKEISFKIVPSNSIYFKRYPYKVVFNIPVEKDKSWKVQLRYFKLDLTGFTEDVLTGPTRHYMTSEQPSFFIQNYNDLKATLILYKDCVSEVHGPVSQEHLDLLYSSNFKCQSKNKLWYNRYDCKVEIWLPFKYRTNYTNKLNTQYTVLDDQSTETAELLDYIRDNLNVHEPRSWVSRFSTTVYCNFDEFLQVYPFLKLSYTTHRLDITKAVLNTM
jgi:hypothetical protein